MEDGKIAIFGNGIRKARPVELFIQVKTIDDLLGKNVIGIMYAGRWYQNKELRDAHSFLMESRKELFNMNASKIK